ncbi:hypothetical protein VFPPC_13297 [Pochonia chlamydosporia 170]|uniref:Uncharacterized protein n=1 Tax=Pochonia chlamydosporia 170 TaxID=1380566 RepID=A0A179FYC0_METCM|nr:hypothetical protein VFPPC_13297 [Pochonia chlamydosporia 170]OAQ70043.1 hypothetical protein VFPPC_13297 [Pochonia chlamydosporia 170]
MVPSVIKHEIGKSFRFEISGFQKGDGSVQTVHVHPLDRARKPCEKPGDKPAFLAMEGEKKTRKEIWRARSDKTDTLIAELALSTNRKNRGTITYLANQSCTKHEKHYPITIREDRDWKSCSFFIDVPKAGSSGGSSRETVRKEYMWRRQFDGLGSCELFHKEAIRTYTAAGKPPNVSDKKTSLGKFDRDHMFFLKDFDREFVQVACLALAAILKS